MIDQDLIAKAESNDVDAIDPISARAINHIANC
jgi:hypothetical protein